MTLLLNYWPCMLLIEQEWVKENGCEWSRPTVACMNNPMIEYSYRVIDYIQRNHFIVKHCKRIVFSLTNHNLITYLHWTLDYAYRSGRHVLISTSNKTDTYTSFGFDLRTQIYWQARQHAFVCNVWFCVPIYYYYYLCAFVVASFLYLASNIMCICMLMYSPFAKDSSFMTYPIGTQEALQLQLNWFPWLCSLLHTEGGGRRLPLYMWSFDI